MTAGRTYQDYRLAILDAIEKSAQFIHGMTVDQFAKAHKNFFAVVRFGDYRRSHEEHSA